MRIIVIISINMSDEFEYSKSSRDEAEWFSRKPISKTVRCCNSSDLIFPVTIYSIAVIIISYSIIFSNYDDYEIELKYSNNGLYNEVIYTYDPLA